MLEFLRRRLAELLELRKAAATERDQVLVAPQNEKRDLNDTELAAFQEKRGAVSQYDTEIEQIQTRISEAEDQEKRDQAAAQAYAAVGATGEKRTGGAVVTREPQMYGPGSRSSYFLDMARVDLNRGDGDGGPTAAKERLQRHAKELEVELPKREQRREERAEKELRSAFGDTSQYEKRVNPNRTDGQGGFFVPPLWLVDQFVALQRAGRVIANSVRNMTLPSGTDSINIPKVATGTATGVQTADAGAVTSTDMTDTSISAPVRTLAGQQDIALQLLDQSPISFDEVIFADLHADYNQKLDVQAISGSGSSGQATGIFNVSSIVSVTYTSASPTLQEAYPSFAKVLSQMTTARFLPPTAWFMHPRRWYWALSQLDGASGTAGRPMIVAYQAQEFNPAALQTGVDAEGPVGNLMGLPVLLDPNIQTTNSSNQDVVYALRTPDIYLWEGTMRTRTLTEVLSGTLQVRLQIYNYFALLANRYASSIGTITGTGLAGPSGF